MSEETISSNVPAQEEGLETRNGVPTITAIGKNGDGMPAVNVMTGDETLHTISVLVENQPGVLARVSHLFARRGYNIESLAVSRTEDTSVSRMTIVVAGDDEMFQQMGKQMMKLIDVIRVIDHTRDDLVGRELALIKLKVKDNGARSEVMQITNVFRANMVDISENTLMVEVVGKAEKIDAIQRMLEKFEILELVRTGRIVLTRGPKQT